MRLRTGFTLLETMIAIVLAGVVSLLVYAAAGTAFDTKQRIEERDLALRSRRAWHALVEDALRNVRSPQDYGRATFALEPVTDTLDRPRSRLRFITAGATSPLTPDADWEVTIESAGVDLVMTAAPIGVSGPPRRFTAPEQLTGLEVHVLIGGPEPQWRSEWTHPWIRPRLIRLTYWNDAGPAGSPVILTLPQGPVR